MHLREIEDFVPPVQEFYDLIGIGFDLKTFGQACNRISTQDHSSSFDDRWYFNLHPECPLIVSLWMEGKTAVTISSAILSFVWWESPFENAVKKEYNSLYETELNRAISVIGKPDHSGISKSDVELNHSIWRGKHGLLILQQSDLDPQFGLDINYWIQNCDPQVDFSNIKNLSQWLLQVNSLPPGFKLPEGWEFCEPGLEKELSRELELNVLHPLRKVKASSVARAMGQDDVLFQLYGHSHPLAEVHLTWSREWRPDWPSFTLYNSWKDWREQS